MPIALTICGAYWFNGFHEDGLNSALVLREPLESNVTMEPALYTGHFAIGGFGRHVMNLRIRYSCRFWSRPNTRTDESVAVRGYDRWN